MNLRSSLSIIGFFALALVGLCSRGAAQVGLQPTPLAYYYWDTNTSAWLVCPNASAFEPSANTPQAVVPEGFNSGLGQWTPIVGVASCPGNQATLAFALTMNASGAGASPGSTFDGSIARILSYNTIGAAPLASPSFTGTVTLPITGSTQCLHVDTSGHVSGAGADCGPGNLSGSLSANTFPVSSGAHSLVDSTITTSMLEYGAAPNTNILALIGNVNGGTGTAVVGNSIGLYASANSFAGGSPSGGGPISMVSDGGISMNGNLGDNTSSSQNYIVTVGTSLNLRSVPGPVSFLDYGISHSGSVTIHDANTVAGRALSVGGAIVADVIYSAAGTPLVSCVPGLKGAETVVSDANGPTFLGTYSSGGAVVSPVMCNGTNWVTY